MLEIVSVKADEGRSPRCGAGRVRTRVGRYQECQHGADVSNSP